MFVFFQLVVSVYLCARVSLLIDLNRISQGGHIQRLQVEFSF